MLARGQVPESIQTAVKLGRMIALSKADGGVGGIVAGDVIRRLVARTMSKQLMEAVQSATSPFQYAMATKAGCECISHVLQGLTELNPNATILSVDGMSAYDTISWRAMLQGLSNVEGGRSALPFVSMFYGSPSQYLWEDERGVTHTIHQGEGGEQGDAMMPLWLSWTTRILSHLPREPRQFRHIARRSIDGGRHPPQPRQNKNLEFSRGETFRVQCFADGC